MSSGVSRPDFLLGLGKATRRGKRKCTNCGTLNGARSLGCKNTNCNFVFKLKSDQTKSKKSKDLISKSFVTPSNICCRLLTCSSTYGKVYSLQNSISSRILVISSEITNVADICDQNGEVSSSPVWVCYSESCSTVSTVCPHVKICMESESCLLRIEPVPLTLKVSVLNSMNIDDTIKHEIWLRAKEPGPLVQIIPKSGFIAVKSDGIPGFEHILFQGKSHFCSCDSFKLRNNLRCFHFYACVAVFTGTKDLDKEFAQFTYPSVDELPQNVFTIVDRIEEPIEFSVLSELTFSAADHCTPNVQNLERDQQKIKNPRDKNDSFSFKEWLSGVTERINQTMHFQFDGKPDPLVFHIPISFFEKFRDRISLGCKKKRLPNSTIGFSSTDSIPLGKFTKHTWNITNIFHVKRIFDSEFITLDVTRSFAKDSEGFYRLSGNSSEESKTYLKVGQMSKNCKDIVPFIIEWTPDILPINKIGELKIKFEFGHQKNGMTYQFNKSL